MNTTGTSHWYSWDTWNARAGTLPRPTSHWDVPLEQLGHWDGTAPPPSQVRALLQLQFQHEKKLTKSCFAQNERDWIRKSMKGSSSISINMKEDCVPATAEETGYELLRKLVANIQESDSRAPNFMEALNADRKDDKRDNP
ncbi:hypothetical protein VTP01DRAFT_9299 [Rhizomucor pusillus]|uniref:uncharacterized protein n=1 Tax=Rhizomucor pusillus TaxID=4840 RepID=UPI00374267F0